MKILASLLTLCLFSAIQAHATEAIVPCGNPPPQITAIVTILGTEAQIQAALTNGGGLEYRTTVTNLDPDRQPLNAQVYISADQGGTDTIRFFQFETFPTLGPGKTQTLIRSLSIPAGLHKVCVEVQVMSWAATTCEPASDKRFNVLATAKRCALLAEIIPPGGGECVGGTSTCSWLPPTGPPRITHEICWDHQPTQAEAIAWTQANCN